MSITWANQNNGVTVWVCTVDPELMVPLVATEVEQALAKRKVKHLGYSRAKPSDYIMVLDALIPQTNALSRCRNVFKQCGGNPQALKACSPPDVVHLAEWGHNILEWSNRAYETTDVPDLIKWLSTAPATNVFYRKTGQALSHPRRALLLKLCAPDLDVGACAYAYWLLDQHNELGQKSKSLIAAFWETYSQLKPKSFKPSDDLKEKVRGIFEGKQEACLRCSVDCETPPFCSEMCAYTECPRCNTPWTLVERGPSMHEDRFEPNLQKNAAIQNLEFELSLRPIVERRVEAFNVTFCCKGVRVGHFDRRACDDCVMNRLRFDAAIKLASKARDESFWLSKQATLNRLKATPNVPAPTLPPQRVCVTCGAERAAKRRRVGDA
jgi:hypothetical protein